MGNNNPYKWQAADICKEFPHTASFVLQIAKQLICGHLTPDRKGRVWAPGGDQRPTS